MLQWLEVTCHWSLPEDVAVHAARRGECVFTYRSVREPTWAWRPGGVGALFTRMTQSAASMAAPSDRSSRLLEEPTTAQRLNDWLRANGLRLTELDKPCTWDALSPFRVAPARPFVMSLCKPDADSWPKRPVSRRGWLHTGLKFRRNAFVVGLSNSHARNSGRLIAGGGGGDGVTPVAAMCACPCGIACARRSGSALSAPAQRAAEAAAPVGAWLGRASMRAIAAFVLRLDGCMARGTPSASRARQAKTARVVNLALY